ncbi:nuclear protein 1-like [Scyliorhinus canicula]|uniref:nuclear protein 1-like n=1 Tax=Scyliorhinus canicula TaxID=7830 RepID=UPI0018F61D54|nr:nuclear protein 1-like [Scyliorhinus canicula]
MADGEKTQNMQARNFEDQYYDKYDFYNISDRFCGGSSRKGRTKKEASENTNRFIPAGHERKVTYKLQRSEQNRKK